MIVTTRSPPFLKSPPFTSWSFFSHTIFFFNFSPKSFLTLMGKKGGGFNVFESYLAAGLSTQGGTSAGKLIK